MQKEQEMLSGFIHDQVELLPKDLIETILVIYSLTRAVRKVLAYGKSRKMSRFMPHLRHNHKLWDDVETWFLRGRETSEANRNSQPVSIVKSSRCRVCEE